LHVLELPFGRHWFAVLFQVIVFVPLIIVIPVKYAPSLCSFNSEANLIPTTVIPDWDDRVWHSIFVGLDAPRKALATSTRAIKMRKRRVLACGSPKLHKLAKVGGTVLL
jgi:hypothetical protein